MKNILNYEIIIYPNMNRLTKTAVIEAIIKASEEKQFDPCTMITLAHIETGGTFNNLAQNGKYLGVFQMSDGYGGVKGNDRLDPYKAAIGTIKSISTFKDKVEKAGITWQPFYIYLRHQQGEAGAFWLIEDAANGKKIKEHYNRVTKDSRGSVLLKNAKKAWNLTLESKVSEWLNHWGSNFNSIYGKCEYKCPVSGLASACAIIYDGQAFTANINYFMKKRNYYL